MYIFKAERRPGYAFVQFVGNDVVPVFMRMHQILLKVLLVVEGLVDMSHMALILRTGRCIADTLMHTH